LAPRDITTALEQHVPLYRRSNAVAENKIVPMYQKKQATAQQAEAVVNGHGTVRTTVDLILV
jgi:hypothetical protein